MVGIQETAAAGREWRRRGDAFEDDRRLLADSLQSACAIDSQLQQKEAQQGCTLEQGACFSQTVSLPQCGLVIGNF